VFAGVLPTLSLVLVAAHALACVLAYMHTAPIDAAYYYSSDKAGLGVLRARPADVMAADRILAFTWIAALPVAVAATLLAASTIDRFHAEGAARVFAQSMTLIGIAACVAGVVLAALGALELLRF
jgi:hypothetical protein